MADIEILGKTAHYTTGGKGWQPGNPTAIMVHGAGLNQTVWVMQSRALAHHGWNVAAPDLPGHGTSQEQPEFTTLEDYARWLEAFMTGLGVERAVVCGHSMGAAIGMTLAGSSLRRVSALVLLSVAGSLAVNAALLDDTKNDKARAINMITAFSYDRGHHLGGCPTPGSWLLGNSRSQLAGCEARVLHRDYHAADQWHGAEYLPRISCPTLILAGTGDRMVPPTNARQLAEAIPGAVYQEFPGAGHDLMNEAPRPVLKAIRGFLHPLAQQTG